MLFPVTSLWTCLRENAEDETENAMWITSPGQCRMIRG